MARIEPSHVGVMLLAASCRLLCMVLGHQPFHFRHHSEPAYFCLRCRRDLKET